MYDLSADAAAPRYTFYLPATAEDASSDGAGSCIRDVEMVPAVPAPDASSAGAPALLATAVVLTGAGRLYGEGVPLSSSPSETTSDSGSDVEGGGDDIGAAGYTRSGEIRHRLIIPPALEEEGQNVSALEEGGGSGGGGGTGGGDSILRRSESFGGASVDMGGSGRDDDEVESPVSPPESPSYIYLNAFAGCELDEGGNDSPDESLIFAEPGLRRRGWPATFPSAAPSAVASPEVASGVTGSSAREATQALARETATGVGALHFSRRMGLLVVARGCRSTLALRLHGVGSAMEVRGGFVLLPRTDGRCSIDVGATPSPAQRSALGLEWSEGSDGAAAVPVVSAAATRAVLEGSSCLPPYTRFVDYWDGASHVAGEGRASGETSTAAKNAKEMSTRADLVCVASCGSKAKADRVLAMRVGAKGGEGLAVRAVTARLRRISSLVLVLDSPWTFLV